MRDKRDVVQKQRTCALTPLKTPKRLINRHFYVPARTENLREVRVV